MAIHAHAIGMTGAPRALAVKTHDISALAVQVLGSPRALASYSMYELAQANLRIENGVDCATTNVYLPGILDGSVFTVTGTRLRDGATLTIPPPTRLLNGDVLVVVSTPQDGIYVLVVAGTDPNADPINFTAYIPVACRAGQCLAKENNRFVERIRAGKRLNEQHLIRLMAIISGAQHASAMTAYTLADNLLAIFDDQCDCACNA